MHFTQLLFGSPLTVLTVVLALAPTSYARVNMKTFFTLRGKKYFPERNDMNGCKDLVPDLESSYAEAAKLINAADTALINLKQPRPTEDEDAIQLWDVQARTIKVMFAINIDTKTGGPLLGPEPQSNELRFNEVVKTFRAMKYGMDFDNSGTPSRMPALYCGTDAWVYLKPEDDDPNKAGKKISDKKFSNGDARFPNGVHHFNGNYLWLATSSKATGGHGICKSRNTIATTSAQHSIITWCNLKDVTLPRTLPAGNIENGVALDARILLSISKIWVHELSHFYGSHTSGIGALTDKSALDEDGNEVIPKRGSYGVKYVWNLAKHMPDSATHNADGYANFALAMYLGDYDWSDKGQAKKIEKKAKTP